jgi:hypothetical protein
VLVTPILRHRLVSVPEWGGEALVRELTLAEAAQIGGLDVRKRADQMQAAALTIRYGWINEDGSHVATDDDMPKIMQQSIALIVRLATAIADMSGLDAPPAELVEEAEKN